MDQEAEYPLVEEVRDEPPPRRKGWTWLAWTVILLAAGSVIGVHLLPAEEEAQAAQQERISLVVLELQGRHLVGAHAVLGPLAGNLGAEIDKLNRGDIEQRLAFMTLSGELAGPRATLDHLRQFDQICREYHVSLTADQRRVRDILRRLYRHYDHQVFKAPSVKQADRAFLVEQLGWFGELALHPPQSTDAVGRQEALRPALITFGVLMGALIVGGIALLIGLCGGIVFLIFALQGSLTWRIHPGLPYAGVYAETFALWLVGYFGLTLLVSFTLPGLSPLTRGGAAMLASLSVLAWPVVRGIPWQQVRRDIGLTWGVNPFVEVGAGIACYVMALPLVAAGVAMTVVMLLIKTHLEAQGAAGGEDFSSSAGPAHPIVQFLADGDWLTRLQIFLLASVIAPFTEETMFRGFLHRHCRELTGRWAPFVSALASTTVVSFLFASIHPQGLIAIPPLMFMAFGFSLMREWRGSLLPSMFAHGMSNGLVMAVAMTALSH